MISILLLVSCSEDAPSPQTQQPTKNLSEIEKVICGSTYKTWKFIAINKNGANVIRECAINDEWTFRYTRHLEINNTGVSCDGQDLYQDHGWDISPDEKSIIIAGSTFLILKMQPTEMNLQEKVDGNPVLVFKR